MKIRKKLPIESKLTAWRCRVVVLKAALKEESMVANGIMPPSVVGRSAGHRQFACGAARFQRFAVLCLSVASEKGSRVSRAMHDAGSKGPSCC